VTGSGAMPEWAKREMTALAHDRDRQKARAEKWRLLARDLAWSMTGEAGHPADAKALDAYDDAVAGEILDEHDRMKRATSTPAAPARHPWGEPEGDAAGHRAGWER